ncbi:MAG: hypothetical protein ABSC56_11140 [Solirubrobacteraceae bacterium]
MTVNIDIDSVQDATLPLGFQNLFAYELTYSMGGPEYTALLTPDTVPTPPPQPLPSGLPFDGPPTGASGPVSITYTIDGVDFSGTVTVPPGQPFGSDWDVWAATRVPLAEAGSDTSLQAPSLLPTGPSGQSSQGLVGVAAMSDGASSLVVLAWADANTNAVTLATSSDPFLQSWDPPIVLDETSTTGVDIYGDTLSGTLYITWTGTDADATPNLIVMDTEMLGPQKTTFSGQSAAGATAVTARYSFDPDTEGWILGDPIIAWVGTDSAGTLNIAPVSPGQADLTANQAILWGQTSAHPPRLQWNEVPGQDPYAILTWAGTDTASSLNILDVDFGDNTAEQLILAPPWPAQSAPAIAPFGANFFMAWIDALGTVNVACQLDNNSVPGWQANTQYVGATAAVGSPISLELFVAGDNIALLIAFTDESGAPFLAEIPAPAIYEGATVPIYESS